MKFKVIASIILIVFLFLIAMCSLNQNNNDLNNEQNTEQVY